MKLQANFPTVFSSLSRLGARCLLVASVSVSALLLGGCNDESEQIAVVTDTFQKRLDAQDKELASLRTSEREAKDQVANLQGRMAALQSELDANRSKGGVDTAALAHELAPLLAGVRTEAVTRAEPPGPGLPATGNRPPEPVVAANQPRTSGAPPTRTKSRDEANGVRASGVESRKRIDMDWGPATR